MMDNTTKLAKFVNFWSDSSGYDVDDHDGCAYVMHFRR